MPNGTLYAVYDLEISPVTFDFAYALVNAAATANLRGYSRLGVIIVRRADAQQIAHGNDVFEWRLRYLLCGVCELLPMVTDVICPPDRNAAAAIIESLRPNIYPQDWRVDAPREIFWFPHVLAHWTRGREVRLLQAPASAQASIEQLIVGANRGRKIVTVTLRDTQLAPTRNSNLQAWASFCRQIDHDAWQVIVVPDPDRPNVSGDWGDTLIAPEAGLSVPLRLALYQRADLNLFVNNGPATIAYLTPKCRFAILKMDGATPHTDYLHMSRLGFEPGGQLPFFGPAQRFVWREDSLSAIQDAFSQLATDLDAPAPERGSTGDAWVDRSCRAIRALSRMGRFDESLSDASGLLGLFPENTALLLEKIVALMGLGRLTEAAAALRHIPPHGIVPEHQEEWSRRFATLAADLRADQEEAASLVVGRAAASLLHQRSKGL